MAVQNLNTVAFQTVLAGNVTLLTAADRIGTGFVTADDRYPSTNLSQGQFSMPRLPESEPRSRQEVVDAMSKPPAVAPTGPVGSFSGRSACRVLFAAHPRVKQVHPGVRALRAHAPRIASRDRCSWFQHRLSSDGRDCQSPARFDDRGNLKAKPLGGWQRAATRAPEAAK